MSLFLSVAQAATEDLGNGFLRHGVAAPFCNRSGVVATVDGEGRNVVLIWLADYRGGYGMLVVDAATGKSEEIPLPFPRSSPLNNSIFSSGSKLYTHLTDHFVEFDPLKRAFTFSQETAPQVVMGITEDDNGVIWSVSYPNSGVLSFNPATHEFKDYGSVYPQDWIQYPGSVAADDTGWIYFGIGIYASQIVAFDPPTRTAKPMLPEEERGKGNAHVYRDLNGKVYGIPVRVATDRWYEFHQGVGKKIGKLQQKREKRITADGPRGFFHHEFPDGKRLVSCDMRERIFVVQDPKTRESRSVHFDYKTEGAYIMGVAAAPDGTLCGNAVDDMPHTFFNYNPKADQWVRHKSFGQWNTMTRQNDRFFVGTYPQGALLEWDPSRPWVDTVEGKENCNPRLLKKSVPVIGRPHDLLSYPDGKTIVMAGVPGYGYNGGGLLFWDRETNTGTLLPHTDVIPEHATYSLVALPGGKLLGGTTTGAGSRKKPAAATAELYVMDMATKRVEWHRAVLPGAQQYTDLCLGPDGLIYGIADKTRFFVFDPAQKKFAHEKDLAPTFGQAIWHQGPRIFVTGPKGEIWMLLVTGIARVEPGTFRIALLAKSPVPISCGGDILGGRIYFTSRSRLYSYRLPE